MSSFRNQFSVRAANLERVYGVTQLLGDTALREGLDEVDPKELQALFRPCLDRLRDEGVLKERHVLGKYIAVSVDATGQYSSGQKGCPQCMVKNHRNDKVTYYHQMLGAVAVHPDQSTVFAVATEAIVKQDGSTKNDCELNVAKRILPQIRENLREEAVLGLFDALYCNRPHIKALKAVQMSYIIGTKGATYVDVQIKALRQKGALQSLSWKKKRKSYTAYFRNDLVLNGVHQDISTNYFEVIEIDSKTGEQTFYSSWITDILIDADNIQELTEVARTRWKIENETFNTLKNDPDSSYRDHFEHN